MPKRRIVATALLLGAALITAAAAFAQLPRTVDIDQTVVLRGNVNPRARAQNDVGPAPRTLLMERMILALRSSPDRQARLDALLAQQQDPASANFHRWLTPEEFGQQFGPAPDDIAAVADWLTVQGFVIEEIAQSGMWINFSGVAAQVERAFRTEIRDFTVDGARYHANAESPSIPLAFADLVGGVVTLHNFPRRSMIAGGHPVVPAKAAPDFTSTSGNHYLSPGDFAIIYNVNPLYASGMDGSGQTIAIVGRTHPSSANWSTFRSQMALPANPPQVIINGTDPGDIGANEDAEADLDVEWSGAVAKNATVKFVVSKSTGATDGVDLSAQYIVAHNLAAAMSTSFGSCEADMGTTENLFFNNLWAQAAAQGITAFVSSGDSGASGCDGGNASSGSGLGVNGLASTPYNVAVGGTQFTEGAGSYWNTANSAGFTSAKSYIPEAAWNESGTVPGGSGLWSTGGGRSSIYGKPSWQVAPGVPADGKRDIPDISLSAAVHDGYIVQTQGQLYVFGGTSASSPSAAGLMALIVQKTGQRQGNANIRFYQLGNAQYGAAGAVVYHDTTTGSNSVPGVTGFSTSAGYDLSTGLGSVDANALVNNWSPATVPGAPAIGTATAGNHQATVTFGAAAANGSPIASYTATSAPGGITGNCVAPCTSINVSGLANGVAYTFTVTATNGIGTGPPSAASNSITPTGSSNASLSSLSLSAATLAPSFASGTFAYSASIVSNSNVLTVTPTAADATATISVNNVVVASGSPSGPIVLSVGNNVITTVVTAQDGVTTHTYTVNVNYALALVCPYSLSPPDLPNLPGGGGPASITVTTPAGCPVTANSLQSWVSVGSIIPNGGTVTVSLLIGANVGPARATSIMVADRLVLITQQGP